MTRNKNGHLFVEIIKNRHLENGKTTQLMSGKDRFDQNHKDDENAFRYPFFSLTKIVG